MTTKQIELGRTQKEKLRKLYGSYKEMKAYDSEGNLNCWWDSEQECKDAKKEVLDQIAEAVPEVAGVSLSTLEELIYSENQQKFIEEANEQGLKVHYDYSGRSMYGDCCPSVHVDHTSDFKTTANYLTDSMGMQVVMYARH